MNSNSEEMQELTNRATDVEKKINNTVSIVNKAVSASDKTVTDFEKTGSDVEAIVLQISEINEISSTNARNVEEIVSAADYLNLRSFVLKRRRKLLSFFFNKDSI